MHLPMFFQRLNYGTIATAWGRRKEEVLGVFGGGRKTLGMNRRRRIRCFFY